MKHAKGSLSKLPLLLALVAAPSTVTAWADQGSVQYSFSTLWKQAHEHSPEVEAADHELKAAQILETRLSRHWYPRIFAEGRAFSTNDPAMTFMSLLGQRQIAAPDFAPEQLNHPGSNFFEHGTLGIDLPLFEGGAKVAEAEGARKVTEVKSFERSAAQVSQYAELASTYASLLAVELQRRDLSKLSGGVQDTLERYHIGAKSNPVGYSGLLGLKNLRNRLEGLLVENTAKRASLRERIRIVAGDLPSNWTPELEDPKSFVAIHLPSQPAGQPVSVRAMRAAAEALEKNKNAEQARLLPKVGLFGTGDLYGGSRGAATSYTAGAYVRWDLFSAPNFGAAKQAEHQAAAAQARADSEGRRTQVANSGAQYSIESLEKNLALMDESTKLLEEQTTTARDLFRNGSINALQLVEVLARRADLLVSRTEAQLGLAQAKATLIVNSGIEGVPHEG